MTPLHNLALMMGLRSCGHSRPILRYHHILPDSQQREEARQQVLHSGSPSDRFHLYWAQAKEQGTSTRGPGSGDDQPEDPEHQHYGHDMQSHAGGMKHSWIEMDAHYPRCFRV